MGIPLLAGRDFTELDDREHPLLVVVNKTAAERYWPGEDPVHKTIRAGPARSVPIVGVVGDVQQMTLATAPEPAVYVAYTQVARVGMSLVVRTSGDPAGMVGAVQRAIWEVDADQPISQIATMQQVLSTTEVKMDGKDLIVMKESDIMGVIE